MGTLGSYTATELLESNEFGELWAGRLGDPRPSASSAADLDALIHVLDRATWSPVQTAALMREAERAAALDHINVVRLLDVVEKSGELHLVEESVKGLTLNQLLERAGDGGQRLSVAQSAFVIGKLLRALAYVRGHGQAGLGLDQGSLQHRTIISSQGELKLGGTAYQCVLMAREPGMTISMTDDLNAIGRLLGELLEPHTGQAGELEHLQLGLLGRSTSVRFGDPLSALRYLDQWPGYRDTSESLAALVQHVGPTRVDVRWPTSEVRAPTSGVSSSANRAGGGQRSRTRAVAWRPFALLGLLVPVAAVMAFLAFSLGSNSRWPSEDGDRPRADSSRSASAEPPWLPSEVERPSTSSSAERSAADSTEDLPRQTPTKPDPPGPRPVSGGLALGGPTWVDFEFDESDTWNVVHVVRRDSEQEICRIAHRDQACAVRPGDYLIFVDRFWSEPKSLRILGGECWIRLYDDHLVRDCSSI